MRTARILAELERAGVRLQRDGDTLEIDSPADFDLTPWLPVLTVWKPALLAALDWHAEATRPEGFSRELSDRLYARLIALESAAAIAEREVAA